MRISLPTGIALENSNLSSIKSSKFREQQAKEFVIRVSVKKFPKMMFEDPVRL